jgi:hypothetical protein
MTDSKTRNPLILIKGLVMARNREDIEHSGYVDALNVLDRHFDVYEQRLSVMRAPASFPDGEVLLDAASQGLEKLRGAVSGLRGFDPLTAPGRATPFIEEAEQGFGLLAQLQEVTDEKKQEFEQAYREFQENEDETE